RLADPRAFRLAVEMQYVGGVPHHLADDLALKLQVFQRQARSAPEEVIHHTVHFAPVRGVADGVDPDSMPAARLLGGNLDDPPPDGPAKAVQDRQGTDTDMADVHRQ